MVKHKRKGNAAMTNKKNTKNTPSRSAKLLAFGRVKGGQAYRWAYNGPYSYVRIVILAGAAGMWVYTYVRDHIQMGDVNTVAAVVAVVITAHLLGGLKVFKR
jgi:hypothetical protein